MNELTLASIAKDPALALEQFVRIFARCDGQLSFSAARGILSVGDGSALPTSVCGFHSVRAHFFERREECFIERLLAGIIPVSLETQTVLSSFESPFTGAQTTPHLSPYLRAYCHCPHRGTLRADPVTGLAQGESIWAGAHLQPFAPEWSEASGVGWVNYTNPHELLGKTWSDCYRFRFALSDLLGDAAPSVPSVYAYMGESPAPQWLDAPAGSQAFWQAYGVKCQTIDALPKDILASTQATMPALYDDPDTWK